jgi:hypothetical protein
MFVVEVLKSAFDNDRMVKEQERCTRYFNNIDDAMADYKQRYNLLLDVALIKSKWDIFVISIFGGSEMLKMQTIRCGGKK